MLSSLNTIHHNLAQVYHSGLVTKCAKNIAASSVALGTLAALGTYFRNYIADAVGNAQQNSPKKAAQLAFGKVTVGTVLVASVVTFALAALRPKHFFDLMRAAKI